MNAAQQRQPSLGRKIEIAARNGGVDIEAELAQLARSNASRETSPDDLARDERPAQPPDVPAIATTTAAAIMRSAEAVIEAIENQREQAKRAFMAFDDAAVEAQELVKVRASTIAKDAEQFITALAGQSLAVKKIGNDVATFGGDR